MAKRKRKLEQRVEFRVAYRGESVEDGTMNVRDIAPAMLEVSDLCQRANELLNGDKALVRCDISANIRQGSFEMVFELWQGLPQETKALFADYAVRNAREILEILGVVGPAVDFGAIRSVIDFLKWRKGQTITAVDSEEKEASDEDVVVIQRGDGNRMKVSRDTVFVAGDVHINNYYSGITRPLERPGIDVFEAREGAKTIAIVTKEERPVFQLPEEPEEELGQWEVVRVAEIVSPQFRDGLKWRFTAGNRERFTAEMKDEDFLEKLDRREVRFGKGDIVRMTVRTTAVRTAAGLKTTNEITEVHEVTSPPTQQVIGGVG